VRTNLRAGVATNAAAASGKFYSRTLEQVRGWTQHRLFLPIAAGVPLVLGAVFILLSIRKSAGAPKAEAAAGPTTPVRTAKRKRGAAVSQCNVLDTSADQRCVWHFGKRGGSFALTREQKTPVGEALPASLVAKDWRSLFQRKVNVAWLPADQAFVRVVHLPAADHAETLSMIEFQLEKLSPMPVAQVVWSVQPLPTTEIGMQSLVVLIVARAVVEEFLGKLEGEGYLADRLDLPVLGQLQSTPLEADGAYIFPGAVGGPDTALVAWFYGKVLRNLDLATLSPEQAASGLREQFTQMAWGGELEEWLTSPPSWYVVADESSAGRWEPVLREALNQPVKVIPPLAAKELAASTASRTAQTGLESGLVPTEFATRYQQQFVDRLWMRALGAVVGMYILGVAIYLMAVQFALFRVRAVEDQVAQLGGSYTNAMQMKAQYNVLKDRQELKFAALDCWKAAAELLPEDILIRSLTFRDGRRFSLQGTAPMGQVQQIYQFEGTLRKATVNGQPLFDISKGETPSYQTAPGGAGLSWSFTLDLKRTEEQ
jgi:hypothetical protein